jgi:MoaA/NifB/PqqE/SkfB family radical SAM enzyme
MFSNIKYRVKSLVNSLRYNYAAGTRRITYPEFLVFYVTFRCNSRCKACNIWKGNDADKKKTELSVEEIRKILSDPLFKKIKNINIQGGEATLREDLDEIVEVMIENVPSLQVIGITSNGLDTENVVKKAYAVYNICRKNNIHFSMGLSIDGIGRYHDLARGEGAFESVTNTLQALDPLKGKPGFSIGTNCVLTAQNIDNVDEILVFQRRIFKTVNLTVVEFREHFMNQPGSLESKIMLFSENPDAKNKLVRFLKKHNYPDSFNDFQSYRYEQLRTMIEEDKPRRQSCQYRISGIVLDHQGDIMLCPVKGRLGNCLKRRPSDIYFSKENKKVRRSMIKTVCRSCYPYNFYEVERHKDIFKYIFFFAKSKVIKMFDGIL